MANSKGTTLQNCFCATPEPHRKFHGANGEELHPYGFFSIEEGTDLLDALIDAQLINPSERKRLLKELQASGLPRTEAEAKEQAKAADHERRIRIFAHLPADEKVARVVQKFCYLKPERLTSALEGAVKEGLITEDLLEPIHAGIAALPEGAKIVRAVQIALYYAPESQPKFVEGMIAPEIAERVLAELARIPRAPDIMDIALLLGGNRMAKA
jgi:hypothetical protein